jgi:hypothetical protein
MNWSFDSEFMRRGSHTGRGSPTLAEWKDKFASVTVAINLWDDPPKHGNRVLYGKQLPTEQAVEEVWYTLIW